MNKSLVGLATVTLALLLGCSNGESEKLQEGHTLYKQIQTVLKSEQVVVREVNFVNSGGHAVTQFQVKDSVGASHMTHEIVGYHPEVAVGVTVTKQYIYWDYGEFSVQKKYITKLCVDGVQPEICIHANE